MSYAWETSSRVHPCFSAEWWIRNTSEQVYYETPAAEASLGLSGNFL